LTGAQVWAPWGRDRLPRPTQKRVEVEGRPDPDPKRDRDAEEPSLQIQISGSRFLGALSSACLHCTGYTCLLRRTKDGDRASPNFGCKQGTRVRRGGGFASLSATPTQNPGFSGRKRPADFSRHSSELVCELIFQAKFSSKKNEKKKWKKLKKMKKKLNVRCENGKFPLTRP